MESCDKIDLEGESELNVDGVDGLPNRWPMPAGWSGFAMIGKGFRLVKLCRGTRVDGVEGDHCGADSAERRGRPLACPEHRSISATPALPPPPREENGSSATAAKAKVAEVAVAFAEVDDADVVKADSGEEQVGVDQERALRPELGVLAVEYTTCLSQRSSSRRACKIVRGFSVHLRI